MRFRQNRVKAYHHRKAVPVKDGEGTVSLEYQEAKEFNAEMWTAGGKLQAEMYGSRLGYIRNVKIENGYTTSVDEKGILHYILSNGIDIVEGDGVCLYVPGTVKPDYKIISIKPFRHLKLEVEKIDHRD